MINEQIETYLNWCENITNLTEQTIGTKKFILKVMKVNLSRSNICVS